MNEQLDPPTEAGQEDAPTRNLQSLPTRSLEPKAQAPEPAPDPEDDDPTGLAVPRRPCPPERLGRYVVLGELGHGGMGVVLEAFDRTLDRRVALKVLHRDLGEEHTKRLLREAQALAKLSHPNVVQVYEVGEAEEQTYIAMELVKGRSLKEWLAQEPRPSWQECVRVYLQAGEGLAAAHARGLVHRDFKPGNAVIDDGGRVRVLDFGLARRTEGSRGAKTSLGLSVEEPAFEEALTHVGEVMGTPGYMAPEQMRGLEVDARSDQFSYCVALYEALYGERPYVGRSLEALMASMATGQLQPLPRGIEVPAALRTVVRRGLAVEPRERWPSMEALLGALRRTVAPRPRRRGWLALGVVGGLVAVGLGLARHAAVGYRCEGARAQLEGVWDGARQRAVEAAMVATKLPYARDTWVRVEARLDAYADAWVAAHTEVCEATSVRQEQSAEVMDLRMGCLHERRRALSEAVDVLAKADATRVAHAVELVTSLPPLPACDDVEALRAELPLPEDPEVAAQVEALRERIAAARALRDAGDYETASRMAAAVTSEAEALPYPPVLAEALLLRGGLHEDAARYAEAEADELRAYLLAAELGYDLVEARAVTRLVLIVGHRQARLEAGLRWGTTALALAKGMPADPTLEASALTAIAVLQRSGGELPAARESFERAMGIYERALGPDHPQVARLHGNLGSLLRDQGKLAEALDHQRRALELLERALGPGHPDVAIALNSLGFTLGERGELSEALALHQRALAIDEQTLGPDHPDTAAVLSNLGVVLAHRGELPAAIASFRRAVAIYERVLGTSHPMVAGMLGNLGLALAEHGELDEAQTVLRRALAIAEQTHGLRHADVGSILVGLADVALRKDDPAGARAPAERAVAILEPAELSPDRLAEARFVLARALWAEPSQRARARTLAAQAREAYAGLGSAQAKKELAAVEAWLSGASTG